MLKSISLSNVRAFSQGPWKFPLRQVTALCGANSAGKSTILKCLLLLRANTQLTNPNLLNLGRVQFSGENFDLGDFRSFVTENEVGRSITLRVSTEKTFPLSTLELIRKLVPRDKLPKGEIQGSIPYSLSAEFVFKHVRVPTTFRREIVERTNSRPGLGILLRASFDIFVFETCIARCVIELTEKAKKRFPISYSGDYKADQTVPYRCKISESLFKAAGGLKILTPEGKTGEFLRFTPALAGILPTGIFGSAPKTSSAEAAKQSAADKKATSRSISYAPLPPLLSRALKDLRDQLSSIEYIAPVRASAKRFYVLNQEFSAGQDAVGDSLPYVMRDSMSTEIKVGLPGKRGKHPGCSFRTALNQWVRFLRDGIIARKNNSREINIDFFHSGLVADIRLRGIGSRSFPLTDNGFGFSQVLPVLVRGLLLKEDGMLIVEQPELHLHPASQIRLAEFFVALAIAGRAVVLETHSEHLINALRVSAAEDQTGEIASKIQVFFLETLKGRPSVTDLSIAADGSIPDLPTRFFGESISLTGRLLRARRKSSPRKVE